MMRALTRLALSLGVLIGPELALAQKPATPTVEKVLEFYQTEDYLDGSLPMFEAVLKRRRKEVTVPENRAQQLRSLAARIYKKKNLYDVFKVAYAKNTTQEGMAALYSWMITPPGIRLRQGYAALYQGNMQTWKSYFDQVSPKVLKPNRKNALQTFMTTSSQIDLYVAKQLGLELAVSLGLNAYLPASSRDNIKVVKDRIRPRKSAAIEPARDWYAVHNFSLFKDLKNEEIDDISKFMTGATGQSAAQSYLKALEATYEAAAQTLAAEVAKGN